MDTPTAAPGPLPVDEPAVSSPHGDSVGSTLTVVPAGLGRRARTAGWVALGGALATLTAVGLSRPAVLLSYDQFDVLHVQAQMLTVGAFLTASAVLVLLVVGRHTLAPAVLGTTARYFNTARLGWLSLATLIGLTAGLLGSAGGWRLSGDLAHHLFDATDGALTGAKVGAVALVLYLVVVTVPTLVLRRRLRDRVLRAPAVVRRAGALLTAVSTLALTVALVAGAVLAQHGLHAGDGALPPLAAPVPALVRADRALDASAVTLTTTSFPRPGSTRGRRVGQWVVNRASGDLAGEVFGAGGRPTPFIGYANTLFGAALGGLDPYWTTPEHIVGFLAYTLGPVARDGDGCLVGVIDPAKVRAVIAHEEGGGDAAVDAAAAPLMVDPSQDLVTEPGDASIDAIARERAQARLTGDVDSHRTARVCLDRDGRPQRVEVTHPWGQVTRLDFTRWGDAQVTFAPYTLRQAHRVDDINRPPAAAGR